MKSKIVSQEIFPNIYWVKKEKQNLLYAPFKGKVTIGLRARIAKKVIPLLPDIHTKPEIVALPTTVTLDITHQCPLRCVYCSVDSGRDTALLNVNVAQSAIDFIFENAQKLGVPSVGIVFGGGGEPTLNWETLTESITHAWKKSKEYDIAPQILVATGGILSRFKIEWLAKNVTHIALSFDGPEEVQNIHRPLASKKESFGYVAQTAQTLKELGADFSIRAAISDLNSNLEDLVEFFSQFRPIFLNFQPVVVCGRCYSTGWKGLDPEKFVDEFKKARKVAKKKGIPLTFPGARIDRIIPEMCHAYNGTGFVVTNRGYISACERVLSLDDQFAELFIYGEYLDRKWQIDQQKLERLKTFKVEKVSYCVNCFCRWHCCGGCLNDHLSQPESKGDPFSLRTNAMCYITREIVWDLLWEIASARRGGNNHETQRD